MQRESVTNPKTTRRLPLSPLRREYLLKQPVIVAIEPYLKTVAPEKQITRVISAISSLDDVETLEDLLNTPPEVLLDIDICGEGFLEMIQMSVKMMGFK